MWWFGHSDECEVRNGWKIGGGLTLWSIVQQSARLYSPIIIKRVVDHSLLISVYRRHFGIFGDTKKVRFSFFFRLNWPTRRIVLCKYVVRKFRFMYCWMTVTHCIAHELCGKRVVSVPDSAQHTHSGQRSFVHQIYLNIRSHWIIPYERRTTFRGHSPTTICHLFIIVSVTYS